MAISGYIIWDQLMSSVSPYLTVSDVNETSERYFGKRIQIMGIVKTGSLKNLGMNVSFILSDNASTVNVSYSGTFPSGLQEGKEVVAVGIIDSNLEFQADRILVKCPSKYEELPEARSD